MILLDKATNTETYIDLDEQAVMVKAIMIFVEANKSYTNAYGFDKQETPNLIVAKRLLTKLIK
jgi:hypothetical protein